MGGIGLVQQSIESKCGGGNLQDTTAYAMMNQFKQYNRTDWL